MLGQLRAAISFDQSMWQVDQLAGGGVGLVRRRHVDDFIWCEATVEVGDPAAPRFTVRGLVVSCHDPARQRATSHTDSGGSGRCRGHAAVGVPRGR